jgi:hypothetical protein
VFLAALSQGQLLQQFPQGSLLLKEVAVIEAQFVKRHQLYTMLIELQQALT